MYYSLTEMYGTVDLHVSISYQEHITVMCSCSYQTQIDILEQKQKHAPFAVSYHKAYKRWQSLPQGVDNRAVSVIYAQGNTTSDAHNKH